MSFQAYLDAIEAKTGRTPQQLLDLAHERGFGSGSKAADVLAWLKECGAARSGRVIGDIHRRVPERHDGIANVFVDRSQFILDCIR